MTGNRGADVRVGPWDLSYGYGMRLIAVLRAQTCYQLMSVRKIQRVVIESSSAVLEESIETQAIQFVTGSLGG